MGCRYSSFEGACTLWEKDFLIDCMGYDENGNCQCDDDPDPSETCESYESDGND